VKQPFEITVKGKGKQQVAGCGVESGILLANASYNVKRKGEIVHTQHREVSLRHFKEEVKEMKHGTECGVGLKFKCEPGDVIECFKIVDVKQEL
jgi:translation initiation factor IF-2